MTTRRGTPPRDLTRHLDEYGKISVTVQIGRDGNDPRHLGGNGDPATVAWFLRDLAEDIERLNP